MPYRIAPRSTSTPRWAPLAVSHLALSESSFRALAAREGVRPIELGLAVTRWRRPDLDALLERLPHRGEAHTRIGRF